MVSVGFLGAGRAAGGLVVGKMALVELVLELLLELLMELELVLVHEVFVPYPARAAGYETGDVLAVSAVTGLLYLG